MEPGEARMDFNLPELPEGFKALVEERSTRRSTRTGRSRCTVLPREEALAIPDIVRTQTNLIPAEETEVRIVDIIGLDVQADGGTHVASTRQIGRLQVVKVENKGRQNAVRVRSDARPSRRSRPGRSSCVTVARARREVDVEYVLIATERRPATSAGWPDEYRELSGVRGSAVQPAGDDDGAAARVERLDRRPYAAKAHGRRTSEHLAFMDE